MGDTVGEHVKHFVKSVLISLGLIGVIGIVGKPDNLTGYDVLGVAVLLWCLILVELPKEK